MALNAEEREYVDAFLTYIEDAISSDERYGTAARAESADGPTYAVRFHVGGPCWIEAAVRTVIPEVTVGFVTGDAGIRDGITEMLTESGITLTKFVGTSFEEIGLDWNNPPVDTTARNGEYSFATPLRIDELSELGSDAVRDKTVQMAEGYLVAFGAAILPEEGEADDE